jgi:hypothetical protein
MNRLYLAILLIPLSASGQSWDYTADLTGTQTVETINAQEGTITDVVTPYSYDLSVIVTLAYIGTEPYGQVAINGSGIPEPINWPTSGAPSLIYYQGIGDAGGATTTVTSEGYATYDMDVCGPSCTSLQVSGTGVWTDPPAEAPELTSSGAIAAITLCIGLGLCLSGNKP